MDNDEVLAYLSATIEGWSSASWVEHHRHTTGNIVEHPLESITVRIDLDSISRVFPVIVLLSICWLLNEIIITCNLSALEIQLVGISV